MITTIIILIFIIINNGNNDNINDNNNKNINTTNNNYDNNYNNNKVMRYMQNQHSVDEEDEEDVRYSRNNVIFTLFWVNGFKSEYMMWCYFLAKLTFVRIEPAI